MSNSFVLSSSNNYFPDLNDDIMPSIFKQYERVIVESLITSFALDFLIKDQYGGDVDTIHNVRKVGTDPQMSYKSKINSENYTNRGDYNSHEYHSHKNYKAINREISISKKAGNFKDGYTGDKVAVNGKTDLDHIISAKEIHDDRGRVLAGLKGSDLANSSENLCATNPRTNRTKKADSMDVFLNKYGDEYTEEQKLTMREKDRLSRNSYEAKINTAYYTSKAFAKDLTFAAGNVGLRMGTRQVLGLVFAEIWFSVKEEFLKTSKNFDFSEMLESIANGIKNGIEQCKVKYKELIEKFKDGVIAGALSSLTTTLCNIFFTTAKNTVKIIRQTYASIVEAVKVLFINPDHLPFGERMRAVIKIISTGASVVLGGTVSEMIGKTPIGAMPVLGEVVQTFCGTLVTGIMSCTLLYFIDQSELVNKLVNVLNYLPSVSQDVNYFYAQAEHFENYAAQLMMIDLDKFKKETEAFKYFTHELDNIKDENELNRKLISLHNMIGIKVPWEDSFDTFMNNQDSILVFG